MISEYLRSAGSRMKDYPHERTGQAYVNALWFFDRDIYDRLHATGVDPFYDDERLPDFLYAVAALMEQKQEFVNSDWSEAKRRIWLDGEQV